MIIIGAKGFAKEVLEVLWQLNELENLVFYDDVNIDIPDKLFGEFQKTAKFFKETKEKCLSAGMNHFLSKPFRMEELSRRETMGKSNFANFANASPKIKNIIFKINSNIIY